MEEELTKTSDLAEILALSYFGFEPEYKERDPDDYKRLWFFYKNNSKITEIQRLVQEGKLKLEVKKFLGIEKIVRQQLKSNT